MARKLLTKKGLNLVTAICKRYDIEPLTEQNFASAYYTAFCNKQNSNAANRKKALQYCLTQGRFILPHGAWSETRITPKKLKEIILWIKTIFMLQTDREPSEQETFVEFFLEEHLSGFLDIKLKKIKKMPSPHRDMHPDFDVQLNNISNRVLADALFNIVKTKIRNIKQLKNKKFDDDHRAAEATADIMKHLGRAITPDAIKRYSRQSKQPPVK